MLEVDIDNPDEIDTLEEKVKSENYNNLFYNLHNQKPTERSTGIDIDNFEAIESYEKLFEDSYKKHQINTKINQELQQFASQSYIRDSDASTENESSCLETFTESKEVIKAEGRIFVGEKVMKTIIDNKARGDILTVAEVAGILGAKKTSELIPHYFSNTVHKVEINIDLDISTFEVVVTAAVVGDQDCRTKALTGCSVALITIFDHFTDADKDIHVKNIHFKF